MYVTSSNPHLLLLASVDHQATEYRDTHVDFTQQQSGNERGTIPKSSSGPVTMSLAKILNYPLDTPFLPQDEAIFKASPPAVELTDSSLHISSQVSSSSPTSYNMISTTSFERTPCSCDLSSGILSAQPVSPPQLLPQLPSHSFGSVPTVDRDQPRRPRNTRSSRRAARAPYQRPSSPPSEEPSPLKKPKYFDCVWMGCGMRLAFTRKVIEGHLLGHAAQLFRLGFLMIPKNLPKKHWYGPDKMPPKSFLKSCLTYCYWVDDLDCGHSGVLRGKPAGLCPLLTVQALFKHIIGRHLGGLRTKCLVCAKIFARSDSMLRHLRSAHPEYPRPG
ncbi:hypothetical protein AMATHDRAFT_65441 [Amanita thiersii Skay4041]|uniref:C2H2-type domain-containing protein n=1 Tax=Amanita thiersii Skay4041 TaxID=703135 RepID=A0A2A9NGK9_9AGAR|nr:hypothetical protein AMATHDRAFT_65441 [Amanita thiersii Skay4041]